MGVNHEFADIEVNSLFAPKKFAVLPKKIR